MSTPRSAGAGACRIALAFAVALIPVALLIAHLPPLTATEAAALKFPTSQTDVLTLSRTLSRYRDAHLFSVTAVFCCIYVLLQSFAIPGPVFLSLLAGPLFGFVPALALVTTCATTGACVCYGISDALARSVVERMFPRWLGNLRAKLTARQDNLLFYLIFLRVSPLLPNWFINIAAPHANIPFRQFVLATVIGLLPANYIHVSTGVQLEAMGAEASAGQSWQAMVTRFASLFALAFLALVPTLCTKRFKQLDAEAVHSASDTEACIKRE